MKPLIPIAVMVLFARQYMWGMNPGEMLDRQPFVATDLPSPGTSPGGGEKRLVAHDSAALQSAGGSLSDDDVHLSHPQSLVFRTDLADEGSPDSARVDSLPPPVRPRLLPDNMSLMEKGLWGEHGVLRGIGIASPLTPDVRTHELAVRRTMLTMHQVGGFLTLGSMIATDYFGQMSLNNPNTGQRSDPYRSRHQTFLTATIALYSATGLLAILSPPPLIRREETSTTTIHKTLAWFHVGGMILTPIIGKTILKRGPVGRYADLNQARFHQISGYATTALFAASMIVVTF